MVFGGLLGYYLRGLEGQKAEVLARVADIVEEVGKFQESSARYWARDSQNGNNKTDSIRDEGEILGRIHSINLQVESLETMMDPHRLITIRSLVRELRQLSTGGEFASPDGHRPHASIVNGCFQTGAALQNELRRGGREYSRRMIRLRARM
jgi:hypothetical protein